MTRMRQALVWAALLAAIFVPVALAATSPLLAWRQPVYIVAGFAGIVGLAIMLLQPLLAGGYLPGFTRYQARQIHHWTGAALVVCVAVHVAGLWVTSPPDVIDALLFTSPTPFSAWGVIAMWAVVAVAVMVALRSRTGLRPRTWRMIHTGLAVLIVTGTAVHAVLIQGTMETVSKVALCALVLVATLKVIIDLGVWRKRGPRAHDTPAASS